MAEAPKPVDSATNPAVKTVSSTDDLVPVKTGKHILTGEPVVKMQPVKKLAKVNYDTGDRRGYTVTKRITGSLNGRVFDLKVGDTVNLNADEYGLFKAYVVEVKK